MKLVDKIAQITRLNNLIRMKSTGTPKELARKFGVSERCIYRLIDELKSMNVDIRYNRMRQSYEFTSPKTIKVSIVVNENEKNVLME